MRMIKRLSCILVCFVTILTLISNMFVFVEANADTDVYQNEIERIQSLIDFHKKNNNLNLTLKIFRGQDTIFNGNIAYYVYICCAENYDFSDDIVTLTGMNSYSYLIYCQSSYILGGRSGDSSQSRSIGFATEIVDEDTSFFGRLWQGLKDMWYSDGSATIDFWFGDDNVIDYWDNIGKNWCDFVKTVLDIDDEATLKTVMTDIYNNDFSRDYWTNIDTKKITQIQNTSSNIKQFWENNVTVVEDNDSYHYEIKNYNSVTNTYPSYLYNEDYFYEYLVYNIDTNNDDVVYWLKRIYSLLVDYFSSFEEDSSCDESSNEEFLKQLKTIIVKKIPLWSQCIEILEPVTNTCIDNLDNDTIDLIEDSHTALLTEKYSISALNSDSQLDIDTTYDTMLFNNLLIVTTDVGNNVLYLSIPVNQNWLGYEFNRFNIPFSHYYNNFRQKISDLLLFLGWLLFAWSVIHRTSKLFGHNSSNKE